MSGGTRTSSSSALMWSIATIPGMFNGGAQPLLIFSLTKAPPKRASWTRRSKRVSALEEILVIVILCAVAMFEDPSADKTVLSFSFGSGTRLATVDPSVWTTTERTSPASTPSGTFANTEASPTAIRSLVVPGVTFGGTAHLTSQGRGALAFPFASIFFEDDDCFSLQFHSSGDVSVKMSSSPGLADSGAVTTSFSPPPTSTDNLVLPAWQFSGTMIVISRGTHFSSASALAALAPRKILIAHSPWGRGDNTNLSSGRACSGTFTCNFVVSLMSTSTSVTPGSMLFGSWIVTLSLPPASALPTMSPSLSAVVVDGFSIAQASEF
mmetsp:Transcript_92185/g.192757  ORF Transcript_92185/g.192757 Transcript_92185/m.192757 type:complete len:324 (-) Transcript_92185:44-1015(-)